MQSAIGFIAIVLALAPIAARAGSTAPISAPTATFMRIYGGASAPSGFVDFCRTHTAHCGTASKQNERPQLDAQRWRDLVEINTIVNRTVKPRSDQELYGTLEHWTLPRRAGDCEDYGLLKQAMLIERGWKRSALLMTVVRDEAGQGHAVLTISTKSGDFILDNRQDAIIAWQASPYEFVKRQSTFDPHVWMALEPVRRGLPQEVASRSAP